MSILYVDLRLTCVVNYIHLKYSSIALNLTSFPVELFFTLISGVLIILSIHVLLFLFLFIYLFINLLIYLLFFPAGLWHVSGSEASLPSRGRRHNLGSNPRSSSVCVRAGDESRLEGALLRRGVDLSWATDQALSWRRPCSFSLLAVTLKLLKKEPVCK